uniref:Cytochrome b561 domain-containing protein n=1 Tax=Ananas comosus var. bracteatus TaxID=296719 RepID=A0A6V7Q482_ANACO|nr:unnamed protein product [Ananas comosus var. bracteatus]
MQREVPRRQQPRRGRTHATLATTPDPTPARPDLRHPGLSLPDPATTPDPTPARSDPRHAGNDPDPTPDPTPVRPDRRHPGPVFAGSAPARPDPRHAGNDPGSDPGSDKDILYYYYYYYQPCNHSSSSSSSSFSPCCPSTTNRNRHCRCRECRSLRHRGFPQNLREVHRPPDAGRVVGVDVPPPQRHPRRGLLRKLHLPLRLGGVGINPDSPSMTGTRALAAFSDPSSGSLLLLPFVLDPSVKLQSAPLVSRPIDTHLLLSSSAAAAPDGVRAGAGVQIFATVKLSPNRTRVHHVWNRGLYVQGYSPTIHPTAASDLASRATIDVVSTATEVPPAASATLRPAHAVLNSLSWGLLLPAGVAVARYLRQCSSVGPTWFYAHAAVQASAYLLGAAGFAIGVSAALLFRPKTTHRFRKYWKSYHHFVGYGCAVVGVVNVFQGMEVMGLGGTYWKLAYCLALASLVGSCVALEVNAWVVFCRRADDQEKVVARREGGEGRGITRGR